MTSEEVDWYSILECSIDSTKEEIEKATRQLSRKYHPDRNKDPSAVQIFLKIQKAKDFLLDDNKRKEYDENIKKKVKRKEYDEKRYKHMDNKRKKMREDLEERLGKFQNNNSNSNNSDNSNSNSNNTSQEFSTNQNKMKKKDVSDIRQDSINRMNEAQAQQEASYNHISEEEILNHRKSMVDSTDETSIVQIKVKWRRNDVSHSDDSLHSLFRTFGSIEDISMGIGGKANTAIITFASHISANAAFTHYLDSKELRVTLLTNEPKKASIFTHNYQNTGNGGYSNSTNEKLSSSLPFGVESDLMREARRAVEREELIKQMAASTSFSSTFVPSTTSSTSTSSSFSSSTTQQSSSSSSSSSSSISTTSLHQKENDILARMMAAKAAKSSSTQASTTTTTTPLL